MNKPIEERRESFRLPFASTVTCHVNNPDEKYTGTLSNVSVTSAFMETDDCPDVGEQCNVEIILDGQHSRLMIDNIKGSIVRTDENGAAISFDERLEWFSLVPLYFKKLREQME